MAWTIGVDVGGTFTDFFARNDKTGQGQILKIPSTPERPAAAIISGLKSLCEKLDIALGEVARLEHGTTIATNALIERRGARIALITTRGFRDLLEIGRQIRPHMFDLQKDYPPPVVERELRFEVHERVLADGRVRDKLVDAEMAAVSRTIANSGVEACAVCFLFSFLNPEHERRVGEHLKKALPDLSVSLSSSVQPEFREYERFSTTAVNAYLQPVVSRYLDELQTSMAQLSPTTKIGISQSSGGLMSLVRAKEMPVRSALSGPAAGTTGAIAVARMAKRPNIVTLDMGGTSTDVCLVRDYTTETALHRSVADFPLRLPMVDIETIGAGGGSVAWLGRDGLLKVGPRSAGAIPGPACYGRGGEQATVTDANLITGRLSAQGLLGGRMPLDVAAARRACEPLARRLGLSVERTAHGMVRIVVSNMVRGLRLISVERGHDPRSCALLAFGGAGPLHASDVARSLGMKEILVPPTPGILCAQGLVASNLKEEFVSTSVVTLEPASHQFLVDELAKLEARAREWLRREGSPANRSGIEARLEMRFSGQNFELPVRLDSGANGEAIDVPSVDTLKARFFEQHQLVYGYFNPDDPVEVVNHRLTAFIRLNGGESRPPMRQHSGAPRTAAVRPVLFAPDVPHTSPIYQRTDLLPGHEIEGPAVIEQFDSTTLVFPGDKLRVDPAFNLLIEVSP
jgi:N-methylhydantoinase A